MSLPMSMTGAQQSMFNHDDDKYVKHQMKAKSQQDAEKTCSLSVRDFSIEDVKAVFRSPAQVYAVFLMLVSVTYFHLGGNLFRADPDLLIGYASCLAETCGLLLLVHKINNQRSVAGVSGSSVTMYFLVYLLREYVMLPSFDWSSLNLWLTEVLQVPQIVLTGSVIWSVFKTHRKSYQAELDILKAWHLVPGCAVLAVLVHPFFREGFVFSCFWGCYMWLDVLALLPQVVMMARGGGKVEAPVAHFVAATTLSRLTDLSFWYYNFDQGPQSYLFGFNYSGYLIILTQLVGLTLVADFMYYYVKARFAGAALSEDLALPMEDMC